MSRQVPVLGGLLALTLVLSYLSWTGERAPAPAGLVDVVALKPGAVSAIRYEEPRRTVMLKAHADAAGRYYRVTVEERPEPVAEPAQAAGEGGEDGAVAGEGGDTEGAEDGAVAAGAGDTERVDDGTADDDATAEKEAAVAAKRRSAAPSRETFTAGHAVDRVVEGLAPLRAHRVLESVAPASLEEMGLAPPQGTLELSRNGRTWTFDVGSRTFDGARQYLRERGARKVYMVDAGPLRTLTQADRELPQRQLVSLQVTELRGADLMVGARTVALSRTDPEQPARAKWVKKTDPDTRLEMHGNWLDKVRRLRIRAFVQEGEGPADLEELATVRFHGEDRTVAVELFRGPAEDGQPTYYARSADTRGLVSLHPGPAGELAADLGALVE